VLIALSGLDGTGKSTQVNRLRDQLVKAGYPVETFWYRPGYSGFANRARARLRRIAPGALPRTEDAREVREAVFRRRTVQIAWSTFALFDMFLAYAVGVRWRQRGGTVVIADRWTNDAVVDLELRFSDLRVRSWRLTKAIVACAAHPDAHIFLTGEEHRLLERLEEKDEPFPDPIDVRERRRHAYDAMQEARRDMFVVDATGGSVEDVHRVVVASVAAAAKGLASVSQR
jgi:thymidylate kinase